MAAIFAGVLVLAGLGFVGYVWKENQGKVQLQEQVASALLQAKALSDANHESGAIAALREVQ